MLSAKYFKPAWRLLGCPKAVPVAGCFQPCSVRTAGNSVPLTAEHYGVRRGDFATVSLLKLLRRGGATSASPHNEFPLETVR